MFKSDIFAIGLVSLAPGADSLATADNDFPIAIPTFSSPFTVIFLPVPEVTVTIS